MKNLTLIGAATLAALTINLSAAEMTKLSYQDAVAIANKNFSGANIKSIELDNERGKLYYEISSQKDGFKKEIKIDANNGEIIKEESEKMLRPGKIDFTQVKFDIHAAKDKAMSLAQGWDFKKIELDSERGELVYEVKLRQGQSKKEIIINANSGEVVAEHVK